MSLITFSDIPRSALACLLDAVGEPQSMSPRLLMGEPAELNPPVLAHLYGGGFINLPETSDVTLTPIFVKVARVLLDPRTNLTIRAWGNNSICGETNIQFPRDIITGSGVILNQIGRMYRISAFADDSTVTGLIRDFLPQPAEKELEFEFKAHLDNTVAAVLFGTIDLARKKIMAANQLITLNEMIFSVKDVYDYMSAAWLLTGFKEMISYIGAVGIMPEPPSLSDTVDGLRILAQAGYLSDASTDRFGINKALEKMVRLTAGQPSGLQWQRIAMMDNGDQIISNRMYLVGDESFMLCMVPTTKGRIYIARVRHKEITDFLTSEILATIAPESTAPQPEASDAMIVPQPPPVPVTRTVQPPPLAAQQAPTQAQPPPVISPAHPAAPTCSNCGAVLNPETIFCTNCGTAIDARSTHNAAKNCSHCGTLLEPDSKFCMSCGTRL